MTNNQSVLTQNSIQTITTTTTTISNNNINNNNSNSTIGSNSLNMEFKHCECKNAKELIQLIRSDAIENIQVSWPDDMGLWYSSVLKSCEVSLQNLVEGIKLSGQVLLVDPTSARYDLSKKKTILVRCSNTTNNNTAASCSTGALSKYNGYHQNSHYYGTGIEEDVDECGSSMNASGGDGEVARSPPSKFSLLLDESEKSRKVIRNPFGNPFQNHQHHSGSPPPNIFVSLPSSSSAASSSSQPPTTTLIQQLSPVFQSFNSVPQHQLELLLSQNSSSTPTSPPSLKSSGNGGGGYQSLKKTQFLQPPSNSGNVGVGFATSGSGSVLGKRPLEEDDDTQWLEEIKNGSIVEVVPDLSNPLMSLCGSLGVPLTSPLTSSDSSPGLSNSLDDSSSSGEGNGPDLSNIDSAERAILEGQIHLPPLLRPRQYHACKIPKEDRQTKRRKNHTSLFCRHCGTTDTPEWRRGPDGRKSLCNACGLHYSKLVKKENLAVPQLSRSFDISELLNPSD
ncbi:putative GATA-binding transcription factor [Tieghemostelium lacteum]|uniref:Putative GATA-binding transcription factor n=1 Tax=Tieghemostelium lacteum TaxID=361077 RepID=A0A152A117_TIELA|nr:putative GATA-binding transcription factor [Tieghemostelium lacteum]|eukprot:KYQ99760.1 putative GATA-binding transcription factor [Tieghemostelium lacteum]